MILGLLGLSGLIVAVAVVYGLTKFSIEDDFNGREQTFGEDTLSKRKMSSNMEDCDQHR